MFVFFYWVTESNLADIIPIQFKSTLIYIISFDPVIRTRVVGNEEIESKKCKMTVQDHMIEKWWTGMGLKLRFSYSEFSALPSGPHYLC